MIVKLIIGILLVWLGYRIYQAAKGINAARPKDAEIQDMVRCVRCGIHLPASEALEMEGKYYCCKDHLPGPE